jgi:long-chain-fatty-acid--[acyl-carrier-protein] ligase
MRWLLVSFLCFIGRIFFRLRYSVKVKGKKILRKTSFNKNFGILFLPNHTAHIDPILISIYLWPKYKMRPIVVEYIYRQSGISLIMKLIKALPMPNFDTSLNEIKLNKAKETLQDIIKGLHKKDNFLLYPGGRLKHTGKEIIGGSSAAHTILSVCPEANIVLIRTTGLWGSSFSRAYTGMSPDFKSMTIRGLKCLLFSFIFFMPRRKVLIEIEPASSDFPRNGTRLEINKYLENWYNKYPVNHEVASEEPVSLVSYSPFKEKILKLSKNELKKNGLKKEFSSDLEKEIYTEIAKLAKTTEEQISSNMNLAQDLGLDSLDIAELITFLSINYDINAIHPEDLLTVQDVLEIANGTKKIIRKKLEEAFIYRWPEEKKRPQTSVPQGKIIQEAFLNVCHRMKNHFAIADDIVGPITYKKLKLSVLALAKEIEKIPGKNIAVLLPASCGAYITIFAILMANKVPVMLNWTLGPRYLNHMMQVTHCETVISSWKFLERLSNVEFGHLMTKMHYVEDLRKKISKKGKLQALIKSFKSNKSILKSFNLNTISEDENCVILFTSGTEANPKAVPLSHKNILSNQTAAINAVELRNSDVFYGILPPFHSFGFSVAGILPILAGIKVSYFPDPTDSYSLAEGIERWKITIICTAPSFLKGLLHTASEEQLKSIRYFVTGAEKTQSVIFDKVAKLGQDKLLIEGYGITECGPMITINAEGDKKFGVGKPLQGIELCIIDPETDKLISKNKEGEICVKGPNVFKGYIAEKKDPFILLDDEKWYRTGDIGYLDSNNNLIISGRIKRFSKVAGEMVSLGAIEDVVTDEILRRTNIHPEGPIVAVCAKEIEEGRPKLILFTTTSLTKNEANMILKEAGFSNLVKIAEVKKLEGIPLMGSGKIDYRYLQTLIE